MTNADRLFRIGWAGAVEERPLELDAVRFATERLGFEPDDTQRRLLEAGGQRVILNCTRQWGKSTVTAARTVWEAARRPRSLVIVVSPSWRQSGEFMLKAREFTERAGMRITGDRVNRMALVMENGSRVVGLPASEGRVRGFSAATMVVIDEASRVPDELFLAIRPFLATSRGSLWLLSTPLATRGFFWKTWTAGGEAWERISVPATACPRISREFLEEERAVQGEWRFRQEYLCEFVDREEALFERETLMAALTRDIAPLDLR